MVISMITCAVAQHVFFFRKKKSTFFTFVIHSVHLCQCKENEVNLTEYWYFLLRRTEQVADIGSEKRCERERQPRHWWSDEY